MSRLLLLLPLALLGCENRTPGVELPVTPIPNDWAAEHVMVLLGNQRLLISHMMAFESPHNFQIILEAKLTPENGVDFQAKYNQDQKISGAPLYTIGPEPFTWSQVVDSLNSTGGFSFHADIHRGDLEYAQPTIIPQALFTFTRALHFRRITFTEPNPTNERHFLLFSSGEDAYLAHYVIGRPSFDQLVMVKINADVAGSNAQQVIIPGAFDGARPQLIEGEMLDGTLDGKPVHIEVQKVVYLEFGGLS